MIRKSMVAAIVALMATPAPPPQMARRRSAQPTMRPSWPIPAGLPLTGMTTRRASRPKCSPSPGSAPATPLSRLEAGRGWYSELLSSAVGPAGKLIIQYPPEFAYGDAAFKTRTDAGSSRTP